MIDTYMDTLGVGIPAFAGMTGYIKVLSYLLIPAFVGRMFVVPVAQMDRATAS